MAPIPTKTPPGAGPEAIVVAPVMILGCAGVGALYAFIASLHAWGIANPFATLFETFGMCFLTVWSVRLAKVRGEGLGALYGLAHGAATVVGVFVGAWALKGAGVGFFEFHRGRLAQGETLFGAGSFALKGWMLATCWVLANLVIVFIGFGVGVTEGARPFCSACKTWASRTRWTARARGVSEDDLRRVKRDGSSRSLVEIRPGAGGDRVLEVKLRGCKCGRLASLLVEHKAPGQDVADSIVDHEAMTPARLSKVLDWAERFPSIAAGPRPMLEHTIDAPAVQTRTPFHADPTPPDGEHKSYGRWDKEIGASDSYANNDFTRDLRKVLGAGDFRAVDEALALVTNANDRANVLEAAADWGKRPEWMATWAEEEPDSATRLAVEGIMGVKEAWIARGMDWVPKNVGQFLTSLQTAWDHLAMASEANPADPVPLAWMIYAGKGLQKPLSETFEVCKQAVHRDRSLRVAYSFFLDAAAPKWGGSREKMLSFARQAARSARAGSSVHVVIPEAHLEMAADLAREQNDEAAFEAYLRQGDVVQELLQANRACFQQHVPTMDTPRTRVYFAYVLWKAGQLEYAGEHLRVIGKATPWGPFTSRLIVGSKETITQARKECGVA